MDTIKLPVASLFQEKLMHYQELVAVLTEERKWIANANVDELWRMSDAKTTIARKIDQLRARLLEIFTEAGIDHNMIPETFNTSKIVSLLPGSLRKELAGTLLSLGIVKEEVRSLSRDNKQYIETYLTMLDDLMSVLTGRSQTPAMYGSQQNQKRSDGARLFHQEV